MPEYLLLVIESSFQLTRWEQEWRSIGEASPSHRRRGRLNQMIQQLENFQPGPFFFATEWLNLGQNGFNSVLSFYL